MSLMKDKKGIVFGVSNKRGIAAAIATQLEANGADITYTYANETMKDRVTKVANELNGELILPCDVTKEDEIKDVFDKHMEKYGQLDFVIHSVAFAKKEDLSGNFSDTSRENWDIALGISAYSLIPIAKYSKQHMREKGSIVTLTYLGGEKAVPNYNVMGVAKSALDSNVRYLAAELGEKGIRVNAISAGPIKTLAAKGISGFDILHKVSGIRSPMKRNVELEEVGKSGLYFCSDLSTGVTGEIHHVDCGAHCVAASKEDYYIYEYMKK